MELLLESLELLRVCVGRNPELVILVSWLILTHLQNLLLWQVLVLDIESLHMLVDVVWVRLAAILALHHLLVHIDLVRFEAHLRHPVCARHKPLLVVLVGVHLGCRRIRRVHVLLHALVSVESLVLLLVRKYLLVILHHVVAISLNACLPRLSLV